MVSGDYENEAKGIMLRSAQCHQCHTAGPISLESLRQGVKVNVLLLLHDLFYG